MRRLRFELAAMTLAVVLAGLSILATFGSARSGDLVFCRMVDGGVVVGVTTDCSDTIGGAPVGGSAVPSSDAVTGAPLNLVSPVPGSAVPAVPVVPAPAQNP